MKRHVTFLIISLFATLAFSQQDDPVLMWINGKPVTRSEFEYLYNKNNNINTLDKKTLKEYVELFINYKLKVAEAVEIGIDTTEAFRSELNGYRRQLVKSYLTDEEAEEDYARLVYEEWQRTGKYSLISGQHIYKYLPQNTPSSQLNVAEQQMDSIYKVLKSNPTADFLWFVNEFSDDKEMFCVNSLQIPEEFEKVVFPLPVGEISQPFFTPQGIHIVKVTEKKDIPPYEEAKDEIKHRYTSKNGRSKGDEVFLQKLKAEYKYTPIPKGMDELLLNGKTDAVLFTIADRSYTGKDFALFAQDNPLSLQKQIDNFITKSLYDYENSRLESKYPEFGLLMQEYRDGILLFEVSSKEVWDKAFTDKAGLKAYFETHKKDYYWELPRYKGIVIHCNNKKTRKQIKKQLRKVDEKEWLNFIHDNYLMHTPAKIKVEEGVFAVGENEFVDKLIFKVGQYSSPESYPHPLVIGRKIKGPENYEEVLGNLTGDYQNFLETHWIARLRNKSKVEINEEVLKTVNNH